jgi:hypothetical protein
MPFLKIWRMFAETTDWQKLPRIHNAVIQVIVSVDSLHLSSDDITICFPSVEASTKEKKEVIVEIDGLFVKPERTEDVRRLLAQRVGEAIQAMYPTAKIECFVHPFDSSSGFWVSVLEETSTTAI